MDKEFAFDKKEFVPIKDFPRYVINRQGVVIDTKEMMYLNGWINNAGYIYYGLVYPKSAKKKATRHLASAQPTHCASFHPD